MAGKYGADVEQLRALAKVFSDASDRLERDRLAVGNQIQISAWVGPAATSFRHRWDNEHTRKVSSVAQQLAASAVLLRKNADEQADASRDTGGPSFGWAAPGLGAAGSVPVRSVEEILDEYLRIGGAVNRGVQDLIDDIKDGELVLGVKPWDLLQSLGAVRHIPGLEGFTAVIDTADTLDKILTGKFDGYDAADMVSTVLKSGGDPVSRLLGANIKVWSEVWREADKAEFSQASVENTAAFAASNPGVVVEEIAKATVQIGSKLVGWLL